jgi:hypothetical protein
MNGSVLDVLGVVLAAGDTAPVDPAAPVVPAA